MICAKRKTRNIKSKFLILSFGFTLCVLRFTLAFAALDVDAVLTDLEQKMAPVKTIQTDFIQEKNLAMFSEKIVLKGKISIQKPGLLSWRVISPLRYAMVMDASSIRQWDEDTNQVQRVSLNKNPSFKAGIEQMQNWFSGSYRSMLADYKINLLSKSPIVLEFIPKDNSPARNFIQRVTVRFKADELYIADIRIEEKTKDTTTINFMNTRLNQLLDKQTWEVKPDVR